jgi:hypothetical protein
MEPQYMIIGQATGVAAALAVERRIAVQDISTPALQRELRKHNAILHVNEAFASQRHLGADTTSQ